MSTLCWNRTRLVAIVYVSSKSARISPDLESGNLLTTLRKIVQENHDFSHCHPSADCALNRLSRPKSVPDGKCFLENRGLSDRVPPTCGQSRQLAALP